MAANIFFQTFTKILYGHYIGTPNLYCYPACPAAVNNSLMQLVVSTPLQLIFAGGQKIRIIGA
jgi:hypothetical protein